MLNWLKSMQMKEDKKDGWSCKWQSSRLSPNQGSSWERAGNPWRLRRALFPAPHAPPPTPIDSGCPGDLRGRPIQSPISLQIAILGLVNVKRGSSLDNGVWRGDSITSSGNVPKMGRESVRKARNRKSATQGWGQISPPSKFQQEPVLNRFGVYPKKLSNPKRMGAGRQCRCAFPSLAGLSGLERTLAPHCQFPGGQSAWWSPIPVFTLSLDVNLFQEESQSRGTR